MKAQKPFWVVLALLMLSVLLANWTRGDVGGYVRLAYLFGLLIVISWIWAQLSTRGLTIRRVARGLHQQLGLVFEERFELNNQSPFLKPWVEIKDCSLLPGSKGSKVLSWIGKYEQRAYSAHTLLTSRGKYKLGPTILSSGDLFGLFSFSQTIETEQYLLVLPYQVDLKRFPFPAGVLSGGKAHRQKTHETTPHAAGVREYAAGDALSRIHWPTTARRDLLMVKEFDQEPRSDVWIFLDVQNTAHVKPVETKTEAEEVDQLSLWKRRAAFTLPQDTFEYAVSVAASVSKYFILRGQAVGFGSYEQTLTILPAERGERQLSKILEILAFVQCEGHLPLMAVVEAQSPHLARGSTVVLITTSQQTSCLLAVDTLARRGMKPVVVLIDNMTFGGSSEAGGLLFDLKIRKTPVATIQKGADLKQSLESGFSRQ